MKEENKYQQIIQIKYKKENLLKAMKELKEKKEITVKKQIKINSAL